MSEFSGSVPPPVNAPPPQTSFPAPEPSKKKSPLPWIIGIVAVGGCCIVVPILGAILFPVFNQARTAAKGTQSIVKLKSLSTAALIYTADNDDYMPCMYVWSDQVLEKMEDPSNLTPPEATEPICYAYAQGLDDLSSSSIESPSTTLMLFESRIPGSLMNAWGSLADRYDRDLKTHLSFSDGHARAIPPEELTSVTELPLRENEDASATVN